MASLPPSDDVLRKRVFNAKTIQQLKEGGFSHGQLSHFQELLNHRRDMGVREQRARMKQQFAPELPSRDLTISYNGQTWSYANVSFYTVEAIRGVLANPQIPTDAQSFYASRGTQPGFALPPGIKERVQQISQQQQQHGRLMSWSQQDRQEALRAAGAAYGIMPSKSMPSPLDGPGPDQSFSLSGQPYSSGGNQDIMDRLPPGMSNGSVQRNGSSDMASMSGGGFQMKNEENSNYMMSGNLHPAVAGLNGRLSSEGENGLQSGGYGRVHSLNSAGQGGGLPPSGSRGFMSSFPSSSPRSPHDPQSSEIFEQLTKQRLMKQLGMAPFDQSQNGMPQNRHPGLMGGPHDGDPKTPGLEPAGSHTSNFSMPFGAPRLKSNGSTQGAGGNPLAARMMSMSDQQQLSAQRSLLHNLDDPFGGPTGNGGNHGSHPSANTPASPAMYSSSTGYNPAPSSGQYKSPDCTQNDVGNRQSSLNSALANSWGMGNPLDFNDHLLPMPGDDMQMGMPHGKNGVGGQDDGGLMGINRQPTPSGGNISQNGQDPMSAASPYNLPKNNSLSARSPGAYVPAQSPSLSQGGGLKRQAPSVSGGAPSKSLKSDRQVASTMGVNAAMSPHAASLQGDGLGDLGGDQLLGINMSNGFSLPESSLPEGL